jgi:4-amino-4-deoxy-L-arabinose transferase-like glycosyltransferase
MKHDTDISRRSFWLLLVGVFLAALLLRLGLTAAFQGLSSPQGRAMGLDPIDYENFAYQMSIGKGYVLDTGEPSARRTPGTSLTLLPIYLAVGRNYLVARIWWCLLSAATVVAVGWLGAILASRRAGIIAAAMLAIYPGHFYLAMHFESEVPFGLVALIATALLFEARSRSSHGWALAAGICFGFAILIRGQLLFAVPGSLLLILCTQEGRRQASVYFVALAAPLVVLAPWIVRNHIVFGKATMALLLSSYTFWGAHNDVVLDDPAWQGRWVGMGDLVDAEHPLKGTEVERDAAAWHYSRQWLNDHWQDMPWLTVMKVWRLVTPFEATGNRVVYWAYAISWMCVAPLLVAGWWRSHKVNRVATAILSLPLAATLITTIVFYGCVRFRDSVAPFFLIFAAVAAAELLRRLRTGSEAKIEASPDAITPRELAEVQS